jgi:hypothetical protein
MLPGELDTLAAEGAGVEPIFAPPPKAPAPVTIESEVTATGVRPLTEAEVIDNLRQAGAPEAWIAPLLTISWCESRHSPWKVGDSGNSLGQYQLWSGWFPAAGFAASQFDDPLVNARVAVYVRTVRGRFGGVGGWSCADLNGLP